MNFEFTQDQNIFYESVRKFAENELAADAVARANSDSYPWDVAKKFSKKNYLLYPIDSNGLTTDEVIFFKCAPIRFKYLA